MESSTRRNGREKQTHQRGTHSVEERLNSEIVRMLETDGRMAFSEIAQRLKVSEGTIRNRVNGMKDSGMLRIVAIADPRASEYKADAMVCVKVAPGVTPKEVADRLNSVSSVVYILWVTGRFDLLIEIVCDEPDKMATFLEDHIHSCEDIADAEVMLGLKNFKNQFLLKRDWEQYSDSADD
ncbi:Lrp/AsnC family transcriptional regulator [Ruegeria sp. EL01]|jgi:Lrp/AsnC family transcriptional regulator for asnA, asnC and gidA|uniref:Lrp/AsnC family transcriptional regulator n=1 Tax=Ruegeria sp. EL01 TaxID=2107578 RepID=UPI0020B14DC3|nr:Lrp/AsnC family transcriptional regulator [Ruegeria sp. EL01]